MKDILGVLIDVHIKNDSGKDYSEFITNTNPYPFLDTTCVVGGVNEI